MPVSAGKLPAYNAVINLQPQTFGYRDNSLTSDTDWGWGSVPATYEFEDGRHSFTWGQETAITGSIYSVVSNGGKQVEVIMNFGDGEDPPVDVDFYYFAIFPGFSGRTGSSFRNYNFTFTGSYEIFVDGESYYHSQKFTDVSLPLYVYPPGDQPISCSQYISFVFYFSDTSVKIINSPEWETWRQFFNVYLDSFTVDNQPSQLDRIEISIDNIETSIENIQEGVVNIQGTVTDMKEQFEDPGSSIWDAAGEKISSTLEDLFVPTPEDIGAVKDGFDQLSKDKLGGAYTAMETVEDTVRDVTNKLHNPDPNVAIEFPGISVPLGGDIGTVTLAEEQPVYLPAELTAILHPVAGTIFSIICGLGTFNVLKDMVECFLSGYSYAAYLHRNKGGSDG